MVDNVEKSPLGNVPEIKRSSFHLEVGSRVMYILASYAALKIGQELFDINLPFIAEVAISSTAGNVYYNTR